VRGERTRLGGSKRVMLSLALRPPLAALARGADEGMMAEYSVSPRIDQHRSGKGSTI
jgi:hypothetical protein